MEEVRKDWCKLPYSAIYDDSINWNEKCVYAILVDISEDCVVVKKMESLSKITGVSPRQLYRILENLQRAGYIVSRKTDGRKIMLEIKPFEEPKKSERKPKKVLGKTSAPDENPQLVEEALKSVLAKKLNNPSMLDSKYDDMKAEAMVRVDDPSKVLAYLSSMIRNFEDKPDNSCGFVAEDYDFLINLFD